jgi:hypothetical protein
MAKPRRHAKPKARKKTTSKRPSLVYRDKPKRTTDEARDLIRELLDDVAESPENVEVARDLAFENEILDYKMLFDIAADLKLDPVAIGNAEWSGTDMWDQSTVDFKLDGIEYKAVETEDVAEKIALASVTQDLKDEPEIFNQDFIQRHINMEKLREHIFDMEMEDDYVDELASRQVEDFWNLAERIAGLTKPEPDEDGEDRDPTDDEISEVKRAHAKEMASDPLARLSDMGVEDPLAHAIEIVGIDIDEAAKEAVSADGWAHFISRYDGEYHTTKHGYVYWRES